MGDISDLEESIQFHKEALELRPAPHSHRSDSLSNLALALSTKFGQRGDLNDLEVSITYLDEALQLLPSYHPHQTYLNHHHGMMLMVLHSQTAQEAYLDNAMNSFRLAMECRSSPVLDQFHVGKTWVDYAHSSHPSAMEAYQCTIKLLPRLAALGMELKTCQKALSHFDGLASNAASCAIGLGELEKAVELLEHGRGVFWSQSLRLRTPLDDLHSVAPTLAQKLHNLADALEMGSLRDAS